MGVTEIFKKSFLEGFSGEVSIPAIIVALSVALAIGVFIYFVYKFKCKEAFYNQDFNNVLVGLPIITAAIVLSMQANIVVSLGMVGALSIVRFRNAVKSSMDLLYLFWSISIGIICGAQIYSIALLLTAILTIIIFVMDLLPTKSNSLLVVINMNSKEDYESIYTSLKQVDKHTNVRSVNQSNAGLSAIFELSCKKESKVLDVLSNLKGIQGFNIVKNDGLNRLG